MGDDTELEKRIKEILGELAGSASLCWTETPKGVFNSTQAISFVQQATNGVMAVLRQSQALDEKELTEKAASYADVFASQNKTTMNCWESSFYSYEAGARYAASKNLIARMPSREELEMANAKHHLKTGGFMNVYELHDYLVAEIERGR